jgi:uncharacterized protein
MKTLKVLVIGPYGAGKTTFVDCINEAAHNMALPNPPVSKLFNAPAQPPKITDADFGRITVDNDLVMYLFSVPGHVRYESIWQKTVEGMHGFVLLVDSTRPETFPSARAMLKTFTGYDSVPYLISANKQDLPDALAVEEILQQVKIRLFDKVMGCNATNKENVRLVLAELLMMFLKNTEQNL